MKILYRYYSIIIVVSTMMMVSSCVKDEEPAKNKVQDIIGFAQKGPFVSGSSITVYDLQSDLSPTGMAFNSQINDNQGSFELSNIPLSSGFVNLRADGFYFNEILGSQSTAQITLYALSEITGDSNINVNLMTHLEKSRVEYLMKNGSSFSDSKIQAQAEILAIFNIEKSDIKTSENLNISQSGDDNGILLAISCILQGYRSESEMTELLSNISNDIKTDGILNSDTLGSALINHAIALDTTEIKSNLAKRYADIGDSINIPDFGKYLSNFISETNFEVTGPIIEYPKTGFYGHNLLALNDTSYNRGNLSLAATLPEGSSLKIIMKLWIRTESGLCF
jgi:hypothetical protein